MFNLNFKPFNASQEVDPAKQHTHAQKYPPNNKQTKLMFTHRERENVLKKKFSNMDSAFSSRNGLLCGSVRANNVFEWKIDFFPIPLTIEYILREYHLNWSQTIHISEH